jgi:hypothetical protein
VAHSSPTDAAEFFTLHDYAVCCVVQLRHQAAGVVHQVVLDPAKIRGELIRIGEWPGDEARGWQVIGNVAVLAVLGRATLSEDGKTVTVTPIPGREFDDTSKYRDD